MTKEEIIYIDKLFNNSYKEYLKLGKNIEDQLLIEYKDLLYDTMDTILEILNIGDKYEKGNY